MGQTSCNPARLTIWMLCSALLAAQAGCTASIQGAPQRFFDPAAEARAMQRIVGDGWYERYALATGPTKSSLRNQIVYSRIYAIDLAYSQYELALTRERQNVGFWTTIANLGVTTTGTLVGGEETKRILLATATGLTGARESYDKNILIDRTIATLQQQMRAQRQIVKVKLIERLTLPAEQYPLEFALSDLEDYFRAGTITGALIGASQDAGAKLKAADVAEAEAITYRFDKTAFAERLQRYARASSANRATLRDWLAKRAGGQSVASFIVSGSPTLQAQFVAEFGVP